jgi:hypothetical protein
MVAINNAISQLGTLICVRILILSGLIAPDLENKIPRVNIIVMKILINPCSKAAFVGRK